MFYPLCVIANSARRLYLEKEVDNVTDRFLVGPMNETAAFLILPGWKCHVGRPRGRRRPSDTKTKGIDTIDGPLWMSLLGKVCKILKDKCSLTCRRPRTEEAFKLEPAIVQYA